MGALATLLSGVAEMLCANVLGSFMNTNTVVFLLVYYFLVVGLAEEGFKYLLLRRRTWNSPHFNCQFDAVVYAVFVSLGFALLENIEYVIMYGLSAALVRAVTAIPGHACFGVFMGAWYGKAKAYEQNGDMEQCRYSGKMALICPVLLHGLYDFIAVLGTNGAALIFLGFIAAMFFLAFKTVRRLSNEDTYL